MLTLTTTVQPFGPAAAIILTDAELAQLEAPTKTPPVVVRVGEAIARLRVSRMGGQNCIGLSKAARSALGVQAGDQVEAQISLDLEERTVALPTELETALDGQPGLRDIFEGWSYTRRKEAAVAIGEAKRPETRQRRLAQVLAELSG